MVIKTMIKDHFNHNALKDHLGDNLKIHWGYLKQDDIDDEGFKPVHDQELQVREFHREDLPEIIELFIMVFRADPWYDKWTYHRQGII